MSDAVRKDQYVYLIGLPIGIVVLLLIFGVNHLTNESSHFLNLAIPITVICFVLIWLVSWFKGTLRFLRLSTFTVLSLFLSGHFSYMSIYGTPEFISRELARLAPWLSVVYILAFWIFGPKRGWKVSVWYATATLMLSIIFHLRHSDEPYYLTNLVTLIEINASSFVIILALLKFARIVEAKTAEAFNMNKLAIEDRLTGLYNRAHIETVLSQEIEKAHRYRYPLNIVILDIDNFKKINDAFGHLAGDSVLKDFARLLHLHLRGSDTSGRWGGEEFMVIFSKSDISNVLLTSERLRKEIVNHSFLFVDKITVSMGVAEYQHGETMRDLIERADQCLYKAKHQGRNQVVFENHSRVYPLQTSRHFEVSSETV